jgi:hypothetical protein
MSGVPQPTFKVQHFGRVLSYLGFKGQSLCSGRRTSKVVRCAQGVEHQRSGTRNLYIQLTPLGSMVRDTIRLAYLKMMWRLNLLLDYLLDNERFMYRALELEMDAEEICGIPNCFSRLD